MLKVNDMGMGMEKRGNNGINYSAFFITINTNYKPKLPSEANEIGKKLQSFMHHLNTIEIFPKLIKYISPNENDGYDKIHEVDSSFKVEMGNDARGSSIHAHWYLKITHSSTIHISREAIETEMMNYFSGETWFIFPYVKIKYVSDERNIIDYMK